MKINDMVKVNIIGLTIVGIVVTGTLVNVTEVVNITVEMAKRTKDNTKTI